MKIAPVTQLDAGKRLDLYLTIKLPQYSRTNVRALLHEGKVRREGLLEFRPNYKVKTGEVFDIEEVAELKRERLESFELSLDLLYRDGNLVAVNKPNGLNVHPASKSDTQSLLNALYYNLKGEVTEFGLNLINRIDKETSGIVLVATSPQGAWFYAQQFALSKVKKQYLAVVYGNWLGRHGDETVNINTFIRRDAKNKIQIVDNEKGDFAETKINFLAYESESNFTLLQVLPLTGRTHQIRVHLQHLGFPVLGDDKYSGKEYKRLMLHSFQLQLPKFTNETTKPSEILEIVAPAPQEFIELFPDLTPDLTKI